MATAGYSKTSLLNKLGIKANTKLILMNPPLNYFELLEKDLSGQLCKKNETPCLIHLFVTSRNEFESAIAALKKFTKTNPSVIIWVSWYKKSSGMKTNITENDIRDIALKNGLVDVKVCAVSELWSGLKLVVPVKNRK
jgi:hypothetical protein